jgi:hypothetical protein
MQFISNQLDKANWNNGDTDLAELPFSNEIYETLELLVISAFHLVNLSLLAKYFFTGFGGEEQRRMRILIKWDGSFEMYQGELLINDLTLEEVEQKMDVTIIHK